MLFRIFLMLTAILSKYVRTSGIHLVIPDKRSRRDRRFYAYMAMNNFFKGRHRDRSKVRFFANFYIFFFVRVIRFKYLFVNHPKRGRVFKIHRQNLKKWPAIFQTSQSIIKITEKLPKGKYFVGSTHTSTSKLL